MKGNNTQVCYSQQSNNNDRILHFEETSSHKDNQIQKQSLTNKKLKAEMEIWSQEYTNKLPINLFHSSAQYNKMIITNGKCLQKNSQAHIDGFINNLQFVNEPIFQLQVQKQCENRIIQSKLQSSRKKKTNSINQEYKYCCYDNYHITSAKNVSQRKSPYLAESVAISQKLINNSNKKNRKKNKNKKIFNQNKMNNSQKRKSSIQMSSNSYLSHKTSNIEHLICKSLISFEQKKRQNKLKKIINIEKQKKRKSLLSQLNEKIRQRNKQSVSKNKSQVSVKSDKSKNQIRMNYWSSIKDKINEQLKNSKIQKLQVIKKDYIECNRKPKIQPQMIEVLKQKYQKEARQKLNQQIRQKKIKQRKINKDLKKLDIERKLIVQKCLKKQFKPNQQMIENAFTNIT